MEDLPKSDKLKFLTDANQPVAHVITIKEEVVATPEAVAAEAGAAPAEPEVIKKGKQEVEGEEGAARCREGREGREDGEERKEVKSVFGQSSSVCQLRRLASRIVRLEA